MRSEIPTDETWSADSESHSGVSSVAEDSQTVPLQVIETQHVGYVGAGRPTVGNNPDVLARMTVNDCSQREPHPGTDSAKRLPVAASCDIGAVVKLGVLVGKRGCDFGTRHPFPGSKADLLQAVSDPNLKIALSGDGRCGVRRPRQRRCIERVNGREES